MIVLSFGERLYRRLLRLYPRDFRDEYGAEMARLYRDRARAEGTFGLWIGLLADLVRTAPTEQRIMVTEDVRQAIRVWRRTPVLAATAILTLALGVGGNTAVFSVVHAVMLRPLPYPDADRLVEVWERNLPRGMPFFAVSALNYQSWAERTQTFAALAASRGTDLNMTGAGDPERLVGLSVTASMFRVLGLPPIVGRPLLDQDERVGRARVVVLGETFWRTRFKADPAIVGRTITLNGEAHEIVGVAPRAFRRIGRAQMLSTSGAQVIVPLVIDAAREHRGNHVLRVVGRLRPGVSLARANEEMHGIAAALQQEFSATNKDWSVRLDPVADGMVDERLRTSLLVLLGAVGMVLLIACANVANLLLARAIGRSRELALRTALGASRARLVRQLLTESVCLAAISAGVGLLVSYVIVSWLPILLPPVVPQVEDIRVDANVLVFALVISAISAVIFGVAPAIRATRLDLLPALTQGTKGVAGVSRARLRQGLVVAQMALATTLLVGAALLAESFVRLQRVPPGFEVDGAITARMTLPSARYPDDTRIAAFHDRLLQALSTLPNVQAAGLTTAVPYAERIRPVALVRARDGAPGPEAEARAGTGPDEGLKRTVWQMVSADYFRAIGTPLLAGRSFGEQDRLHSPPVVILSQSVARSLGPDRDPIGETLDVNDRGRFEVIGVVGDIRDFGEHGRGAAPSIYFSAAQQPQVATTLVVRAVGEPAAIASAIRAVVRRIDPAQPIYTVRTLREWLAESTAQPRLTTTLTGIFAGMALLLAAVGIYGVLAYSVGQRTREIGVRMAMGAARGEVLRLVLRGGMTWAVAGITLGLIGAFALSRVLANLLFEVPARDPLTFASVAIALALVALAACYVPAARATRIDPLIALRTE